MTQIRTLFFAIVLALTSVAVFAIQPVNINTADAQTLSKVLKGIGPNKAQAIVAYRKKNGPFKSVSALTQVKGIGEKILDANKKLMTVKSN